MGKECSGKEEITLIIKELDENKICIHTKELPQDPARRLCNPIHESYPITSKVFIVEHQKTVVGFLDSVDEKMKVEFKGVIIIDLRGVRLVAKEVSERINESLGYTKSLGQKIVVLTWGPYLHSYLDKLNFDKKLEYLKESEPRIPNNTNNNF